MPQKRVILCMKWGSLYSADYVNILYNACRAATTKEFRFVCLTDDFSGYVDGVEPLPIPNIGLSEDEWYTPGVWPKLAIYVADLHGLTGRCLFIDLDMMVLRGLDDFFNFGSGLIATDMGPGWENPPRVGQGEVATSVFAFDLGKETQILDAFLADKEKAKQDFINEQDFVGAHASKVGFWPPGWVLSFKRHLRQPIGLDLFLQPKEPPESVRILAFHGDPRPVALTRAGKWARFPHSGKGPVSWMVDYWERFGA